MKRSELVAEIAERVDVRRSTVKDVLDAFATVAAEELLDGGEVPLGKDLGKLVVKQRRARKGRNPQTGEPITIPARKVVQFRMSQRLREVLEG